ncbi:hypothetical protein C2134_03790 [Chromobacterium sinusclupearum]|uniref:Uncharacterized protein n=2 Tax=Chromobacterium TaxID=535 RepID=A0A2K4MT06_9NEIS|nr:hypothetical protein C2134_03790 [Chromobacterium sinusclupearum]PRP69149.1 hypothetical protein BUE93_18390 [Chromobacterium amazonense]
MFFDNNFVQSRPRSDRIRMKSNQCRAKCRKDLQLFARYRLQPLIARDSVRIRKFTRGTNDSGWRLAAKRQMAKE